MGDGFRPREGEREKRGKPKTRFPECLVAAGAWASKGALGRERAALDSKPSRARQVMSRSRRLLANSKLKGVSIIRLRSLIEEDEERKERTEA